MSGQLRSMTGFGTAVVEGTGAMAGWTFEASLRAVNHRQLDVRWSAPTEWAAHESAFVADLKAALHRGRVEGRLTVRRQLGADGVDAAHVAAVAERLRAVAAAAGIAEPLTLRDLVTAGALQTPSSVDEISDEAVAVARDALRQALANFLAFRQREGRALETVFDEQLAVVEDVASRVDALRLDELAAYQARLAERVNALLGDTELAEDRLAAEVALLAERTDVAEEIQRATAHVGAVRELLAGPGPHGKRLDFLLQELIRETNTMASKASSSAVTHAVVDAKTAVERMREQALNVE